MKQRKWPWLIMALSISVPISGVAIADHDDGDGFPQYHFKFDNASTGARTAVRENQLGRLITSGVADKEVVIGPSTEAIHVTDGETVRIVSGGRAFMWDFSPVNSSGFPLAAVAPKDFPAGNLQVYIHDSRALEPE